MLKHNGIIPSEEKLSYYEERKASLPSSTEWPLLRSSRRELPEKEEQLGRGLDASAANP